MTSSMIALENVSKSYNAAQNAVENVTLDIEEGEFFSLLGPSGCGKTTLLRMIGGFDLQSSGIIRINGVDMGRKRPDKRPTNMVFQSYALFPHLTIDENIGYGLLNRQISIAGRQKIIDQALEKIRLSGLGKRRPHQLSGGQRQRVALARALVCEPKVLLLDEPLAALDKSLREEMQLELRGLQKDVGVTFVFVTHDQEEALALSDRVAVMSGGRLLQVDRPADVYRKPRTLEVAKFVGKTNLLKCVVTGIGSGRVHLRADGVGEFEAEISGNAPDVATAVVLVLRPEELEISADRPGDNSNVLQAELLTRVFLGNIERITCKVGVQKFTIDSSRRVGHLTNHLWIKWAASSGIVLRE